MSAATPFQVKYTEQELDAMSKARMSVVKRQLQGFVAGGLVGWFGCQQLGRLQRLHPSHRLLQMFPQIKRKHVIFVALVEAAMLSYVTGGYEHSVQARVLLPIWQRKAQEAQERSQEDPFTTGTAVPVNTDLSTQQIPPSDKEHATSVAPLYSARYKATMGGIKASEESHARRMEAIDAKKQREKDGKEGGGSFGGVFKW